PAPDRRQHGDPPPVRRGRLARRPRDRRRARCPCRLARAQYRRRPGPPARSLGLTAPGKASAPAGLSLRVAAAERLRDVLSGAHFTPFASPDIADTRDRALANRLVTTALRHHGHLNLVLERLLDRGMPKKSGSFEATLRVALAQLLYLPEIGAHSVLFLAVEAVKRDPRAAHLAKLM